MTRFARLWTLVHLFASITGALAQPSWVKAVVSKEVEFPIHAGSAYVTLHDVMRVEVRPGPSAEVEWQIAIKILTQEGEAAGGLSVPMSPRLKIDRFRGWRLRAGKVEKLRGENKADLTASMWPGNYDDEMRRLGVFLGTKPGDIIVFEVRWKETGNTSDFHTFLFQRQQPVKFAQFAVEIPNGWHLSWSGQNIEGIDYRDGENTHTWTARKLQYQSDEPLAPRGDYYVRRILVNAYPATVSAGGRFSNWQEVAEWVSASQDQPARPGFTVRQKAHELTYPFDKWEDKVSAVAGFVRDEIRYVAIEIGKWRWIPNSAETTLSNRYGDCKDKAALMRAMLEAAGIQSAAALAVIRKRVDSEVPTPFQFNHCIVAIPVDETSLPGRFKDAVVNNWLLYDPTDPVSVDGEISSYLQGTAVLIGDSATTEVSDVPRPAPQKNYRHLKADAVLEHDGAMSASVMITHGGRFAAQLRQEALTLSVEDMIEQERAWLKAILPVVAIDNYQLAQDSGRAVITYDMRGGPVISTAGELMLLQLDPFSKPHDIQLHRDERHHPVWFGSAGEHKTQVYWHLPADMFVASDSFEVNGACATASIFSRAQGASNKIDYFRHLQLTGEEEDVSNYAVAQEYERNLARATRMTFIIRKVDPQ